MEEAQLREDLKAVEAALKKTKKVVCAVQRSSSTAVDYDYKSYMNRYNSM